MSEKGFGALDLRDTAELLCITKRQLQNLVELGCPKEGHGKGSYYVWKEVLKWYIAYQIALAKPKDVLTSSKYVDPDTVVSGESLAQATTRKIIAEADLKELERAHQRGEVVAVADVERSIAEVAGNVKSKLLAIPTKLASILAAQKGDKARIKAVLDSEMRQVCNELATMRDE